MTPPETPQEREPCLGRWMQLRWTPKGVRLFCTECDGELHRVEHEDGFTYEHGRAALTKPAP